MSDTKFVSEIIYKNADFIKASFPKNLELCLCEGDQNFGCNLPFILLLPMQEFLLKKLGGKEDAIVVS